MKLFLRTFSYREVQSSLFTSMMIISLFFLFINLNLFDTKNVSLSFVFLVSMFLKHRFYLLEHKRRNRILGRILHDLLTSFLIIIFFCISLKVIGKFYRIGSYFNVVVITLVYIMLSEITLTIINKILNRLFKVSLW